MVPGTVVVRITFNEDFEAIPGATGVMLDVLEVHGIVLGATEMIPRATEDRSVFIESCGVYLGTAGVRLVFLKSAEPSLELPRWSSEFLGLD